MKARFCFAALVSIIFSALAPASTFYDWRSANFTSAQLGDSTISGATVDPDGDGLANLHEYAFFGQPLSANQNLMPVLSQAAGHLVLTYRERHDVADVSIRLQGSDTLSNWITYNSVTEADREVFTDYDEVTLIDPQPFSSNRRFLRLRVELLPINEPRAPTQLSLKVVTPTSWTVGWTDPNLTETGYAVEHRLPTNVWQGLTTLGADTGGWQHTAADYQTSTTYRVVAIGAGGAEAESAPITLPDTDGDGIPDALELGSAYTGSYGTYASKPDEFSSNASGVSDGWLAANGFDPAQPFDGEIDTDGDGFSDAEEARRGTDPHSADTDDDGVPDPLDGWPRDPKLSPPVLPDVRYAVVPITGVPAGYLAGSVDDAGRVACYVYGAYQADSLGAGLWTLENGFTSLPELSPLSSDFPQDSWQGGQVWRTYLLWDSNSWQTYQSKDGWLAVHYPGTGESFTRLYHPDRGVVDVPARLTPQVGSDVNNYRWSGPGSVSAGGRLLLQEQGGSGSISTTGSNFYIGFHATGAEGQGGTEYWAELKSVTSTPPGQWTEMPCYLPTLMNDEGVTLGYVYSTSFVPQGPNNQYWYWEDDGFRSAASKTNLLQATYHYLGSGELPVALGTKAEAAWRAVKTSAGWDEALLQVWDPVACALVNPTTLNTRNINRRREILASEAGTGKSVLIRNGVRNSLSDLVPAAWSTPQAIDINNHGVILAHVTRTLDDQGQSISNPQPEPVLLVPVEIKVKSRPYSSREHPRGPVDNLIAIWRGDSLVLHADIKIEFPAGGLPPNSISWSAPNHEIAANSSDAIFNWSTPGLRMIEVMVFGLKKKVYVTVPDVGNLTEAEAALLDPFGAANAVAYSSIASSWASSQGDNTGIGGANALQHSYWNALMASDALMGPAMALFFSTAHENSNRFRDGGLAFDSAMDLNNNLIGSTVVHTTMVGLPDFSVIQNELVQKLSRGDLWIIAPFSISEIGHIIKSNGKKIFTTN